MMTAADPAGSEASCICMECRIRTAIHGERRSEPGEVDVTEAVNALGNVLAELLAFHPKRETKRFKDQITIAVDKWRRHPRVMAQQKPAGHA